MNAKDMEARHEAAMQQCMDAITRLCRGTVSCALGLVLVGQTVTSPRMLAGGKLLKDLWFTPAVLSAVLVVSAWLWVVALPFKWLGLIDPTWRDFVQVSSMFALMLVKEVLTGISPAWFFHVLSTHDEGLSGRVRSLPIVFGLKEKAKHWAAMLVGGAVALGLLVAAVSFFGPLLAAVSVGIFAAWYVIVAVVAVACVLAGLLGGMAYVYTMLSPFLKLWRFDPVMACLALLIIVCGVCTPTSIVFLLRTGALMYYSCTLLTSQLLAQYSERLRPEDWATFQRQHCWQMFGFGLPIWLLMHLSPVSLVLTLQAFQGASARLLADLLAPQKAKDSL